MKYECKGKELFIGKQKVCQKGAPKSTVKLCVSETTVNVRGESNNYDLEASTL